MITGLTQNQLVMTEPKPTASEMHSELEHIVILYDLCSLGIIQRRVL